MEYGESIFIVADRVALRIQPHTCDIERLIQWLHYRGFDVTMIAADDVGAVAELVRGMECWTE